MCIRDSNYPILCEGIQSTFLLNDKRFSNRRIVLRLHNIENEYYAHLYNASTIFFKKLFYARECNLLKRYEAAICKKDITAVSYTHLDVYKRQI